MVETIETQSYSGVLCRSCRQPIPLPTVVGLEPADRAANPELANEVQEARVFTLRCRACDKERPYRRSDIKVFEGTPRPRILPPPLKALRSHKLSRSANA
jgi:hypothetical protein